MIRTELAREITEVLMNEGLIEFITERNIRDMATVYRAKLPMVNNLKGLTDRLFELECQQDTLRKVEDIINER